MGNLKERGNIGPWAGPLTPIPEVAPSLGTGPTFIPSSSRLYVNNSSLKLGRIRALPTTSLRLHLLKMTSVPSVKYSRTGEIFPYCMKDKDHTIKY
jgi:hypothetical protein